MSAKTLQTDYDKTKAEIKVLETKLKEIEKQAKKEGLFFKSGKIVGNDKILAAFWDGNYYSHFDGHKSSAVYDEFSGSEKLKKDNIAAFNKLLVILKDIKTVDQLSEEDGEILGELLSLNKAHYLITDNLGDMDGGWNVKVTKDSIKFTYIGSEDQGELSNESEIEFKYVNESELIKCKEREYWD